MPGIESEEGGQGEKLKWEGLTGDVKFSPEFKDVDTGLKSPGLHIAGKDSDVTITGLEAESKIKYVGPENKYPVGDINFTVGGIVVKSKDENSGEYDNFSITGIGLTGTSTESEGILDSTHSLGFKELDAGGSKYGPGGYELAIRNIDMASWVQIQELLKKNQNASQTEEERALFMSELMKIVPGLIKKSPEIELTKLSIKTSGSLDGHLKISVDGSNMDNPGCVDFFSYSDQGEREVIREKPPSNRYYRLQAGRDSGRFQKSRRDTTDVEIAEMAKEEWATRSRLMDQAPSRVR
jgi:uncharacterized protein YdgA (DUF945 family)